MDQPKSQTTMACCHAWAAACFFLGGGHNHNSLPLGPIQPSSHSTEELLDLAYDLLQRTKF